MISKNDPDRSRSGSKNILDLFDDPTQAQRLAIYELAFRILTNDLSIRSVTKDYKLENKVFKLHFVLYHGQ